MTQEELIAIMQHHCDRASEALLQNLMADASAPFMKDRQERRDWLQSLSARERSFVLTIMRRSMDAGLYWLVCVLDGIQSVDTHGGRLELAYRSSGGGCVLLNDPSQEPLNEIFRDEKYQRP